MKQRASNTLLTLCLASIGIGLSNPIFAMGLRSFVALPVEKGGTVTRFAFEHADLNDTNIFMTSAAYGLSNNQTLLFGVPYRLSPEGDNKLGNLSALYRHTIWQQDRFSGTTRFALLGGAVIPTHNNRDSAIQTGFVFTHFQDRHELDVDALYQVGMNNRDDSGRYDISWQYRLTPAEYPDWGISSELHSVLELNGRWRPSYLIAT